MIFLFCAAGYRNGEEKPQNGTLEKIPFDVFTALYLLLGAVGFIIISGFSFNSSNTLVLILECLSLVLLYLLALSYLISFAVRLKAGGLVRNMLIYRIFAWFFRKIGTFLPIFR